MIEGVAAAAAALLHAGPGAADILARIAGVAGDVARAEAGRIAALDRPGRAQALARRVAELRSPVPVGLALVHRDWVDAALAGEGTRVRDIVVGGAPVAAPVRVWLERRIYGSIAATPLAAAGAPLVAETLAHRAPAAIEGLLRRAGIQTLAVALGAADGVALDRAAVAAVAARLGAAGSELVAAAAAMTAAGQGAGLGSRRAAARRAAGIAVGDDPDALVAIGARSFAPHLVGAPARQVAQRFPRSRGLRLLAELAAFAGAADGPSWEALVLA